MEFLKKCDHCDHWMSYNSFFSAYYCSNCGHMVDVPDLPDINIGVSYIVEKPPSCENRYILIVLFKHKDDGTYSWVNFTKGHICPCRFKTVEDAIADLENFKAAGKLVSYVKTTQHII